MGLTRHLLPVALLAGAGAPYLLSTGGVGKLFGSKPAEKDEKAAHAPAKPGTTSHEPTKAELAQAAAHLPDLDGPDIHDLGEVIRFDVGPDWVLQHWARVTTSVPDKDYLGYRIPLVSGTKKDDVAASLTYYFDNKNVMQRLTLHGTTGDARRLIQLLTQRYGFQERASAIPGELLYTYVKFGRTESWLKIEPAQLLTPDQAHARQRLSLVMMRPPTMK